MATRAPYWYEIDPSLGGSDLQDPGLGGQANDWNPTPSSNANDVFPTTPAVTPPATTPAVTPPVTTTPPPADKKTDTTAGGGGNTGGAGGSVGGNTSVPGGGNNAGYDLFSDPAYAQLAKLAQDRINGLNTPPPSTALDAYLAELTKNTQANQSRAQDYAKTIRDREAELQGPAYTDQQSALMHTKAIDALEKRRQQTLANNRENIYARGFAPTSGIAEGSDRSTNSDFESQRTGIESDLLLGQLQANEARKNQSLQLEAMAQAALNGGDTTSLTNFGNAASIESQQNAATDQRQLNQLSAAGIPVALHDNAIQLALQILGGGGGNPTSVIDAITGMNNSNNQSKSLQIQSNGNNMAGLGNLASILQKYFSSL